MKSTIDIENVFERSKTIGKNRYPWKSDLKNIEKSWKLRLKNLEEPWKTLKIALEEPWKTLNLMAEKAQTPLFSVSVFPYSSAHNRQF